MLKTAFCVCKLIIGSMKKYTLITKLQRRYHPCCEQCFIILSIPICFRSAQYYKYFFCLLYYYILLELYYLTPQKNSYLPNRLPFFQVFCDKKNNTFFFLFLLLFWFLVFLAPKKVAQEINTLGIPPSIKVYKKTNKQNMK